MQLQTCLWQLESLHVICHGRGDHQHALVYYHTFLLSNPFDENGTYHPQHWQTTTAWHAIMSAPHCPQLLYVGLELHEQLQFAFQQAVRLLYRMHDRDALLHIPRLAALPKRDAQVCYCLCSQARAATLELVHWKKVRYR